MGFLASLSQWLDRLRLGDGAGGEPLVEAEADEAADGGVQVVALVTDGPAEIAVGVNCLLTVTDRRFVVEIVEVRDDTIRITFPGIDYPIQGMLVDIEFHDHTGFSYYQTKVVQGPHKEGDGVILERPTDASRSQHRDSCRVPTDLVGQWKLERGGESYEARISNVSTGGAMIQSPGCFEVGMTLELALALPGEPDHILSAQILHAGGPKVEAGEEIYTYGTRFTGYEPGAGRSVTRFIWGRLKELYPSV